MPKGYQATNGMTYHGGSVMRTNTVHAVYWDGSASDPFPANYENLVSGFVANVAHDSGGRSNVYSTDIQYYDHQGHIQYKSTFAGASPVMFVTWWMPSSLILIFLRGDT